MNPTDDMTDYQPASQLAYTTDDPAEGVCGVADLMRQVVDPAQVNAASLHIAADATNVPFLHIQTRADAETWNVPAADERSISSYTDSPASEDLERSPTPHPEHPLRTAVAHWPVA